MVVVLISVGSNLTPSETGWGTQLECFDAALRDAPTNAGELAEPDFGFDGHADAEDVVGVFALVEADADGEALDYFDEIAGGVFWWEKTRD